MVYPEDELKTRNCLKVIVSDVNHNAEVFTGVVLTKNSEEMIESIWNFYGENDNGNSDYDIDLNK